ncbi:MAG TPA: DUF4159 domain-containing protein [Polyangiaceae bacterium]
MTRGRSVGRRALVASLAAGFFVRPREAAAFGEAGAFNARLLLAGKSSEIGMRKLAPARWGRELVRRTSAPARSSNDSVRIDRPALFREPFTVWCGSGDVGALSATELRFLEKYLRLGGMLVVDDAEPRGKAFGRSVRREIGRVLPESPPVRLDATHVLYKTFYLVDRPVGRVLGPPYVEAVVRGKSAQVLFLEHDLLGALAEEADGSVLPLESGAGDAASGFRLHGLADQRERAIRFAVNIAMYALCSDYKDDVVHAPFILKRRGRRSP